MQYQKVKKTIAMFALVAAVANPQLACVPVYADEVVSEATTKPETASEAGSETEVESLEDSVAGSAGGVSAEDALTGETSLVQGAETDAMPNIEIVLPGESAAVYPQPISVEPEKELSEVERTQWIIEDDVSDRIYSTNVNIPAGTTRFEVFYTADATPPKVSFTSLDGDVYVTGRNSPTETKFVTRQKLKVASYSNILYEVIYISNPVDPGTWKMNIEIDRKTNEMFFVNSQVPENWESLATDYKTACNNVMVWFIDDVSKYNASNIPDIVKKDTELPGTNNMTPNTDPEPVEEINYVAILIMSVLSVVVLVGGFLGYKVYVSKKQDVAHRQKKVKIANEKTRQRLEERESTLETVLDKYADEYADDDYSDDSDFNDYADEDSDKEDSESETMIEESEASEAIAEMTTPATETSFVSPEPVIDTAEKTMGAVEVPIEIPEAPVPEPVFVQTEPVLTEPKPVLSKQTVQTEQMEPTVQPVQMEPMESKPVLASNLQPVSQQPFVQTNMQPNVQPNIQQPVPQPVPQPATQQKPVQTEIPSWMKKDLQPKGFF